MNLTQYQAYKKAVAQHGNPKTSEQMEMLVEISKKANNTKENNNKKEGFEAEGKPTSVEVKRSTNEEKKLMAVFTYPDERTKTTHFGQRGASDYTKHGEKERMKRYLERHGGGTTTSTGKTPQPQVRYPDGFFGTSQA